MRAGWFVLFALIIMTSCVTAKTEDYKPFPRKIACVGDKVAEAKNNDITINSNRGGFRHWIDFETKQVRASSNNSNIVTDIGDLSPVRKDKNDVYYTQLRTEFLEINIQMIKGSIFYNLGIYAGIVAGHCSAE